MLLTLYLNNNYHWVLHMTFSQYDLWFLLWTYLSNSGVTVDFNWLSEKWEYFGVSYYQGVYDAETNDIITNEVVTWFDEQYNLINGDEEEWPFNERTAIIAFTIEPFKDTYEAWLKIFACNSDSSSDLRPVQILTTLLIAATEWVLHL